MKIDYETMAFAKINLFLRCCGKYDNGYHRLYMLMQQIGLGDDIFIEFDDLVQSTPVIVGSASSIFSIVAVAVSPLATALFFHASTTCFTVDVE